MKPQDRQVIALLVFLGMCLAIIGGLGYVGWHFFHKTNLVHKNTLEVKSPLEMEIVERLHSKGKTMADIRCIGFQYEWDEYVTYFFDLETIPTYFFDGEYFVGEGAPKMPPFHLYVVGKGQKWWFERQELDEKIQWSFLEEPHRGAGVFVTLLDEQKP